MINLGKSYWSNRYKKGEIGWDIGSVSRPLKMYFDQLTDTDISILIPGCGNGYEAEYLYRLGFRNIYVLDLVQEPINNLLMRYNKFPKENCFVENIIDWQTTLKFDLIVEQTIFCAIHPNMREKYVQNIHSLLNLKGKYIGLLFNKFFENGPPFGGNKEEYEIILTKVFSQVKINECYNSIDSRKNTELFINCKY